jgi:serine/threonine protein phosphatase PrpC
MHIPKKRTTNLDLQWKTVNHFLLTEYLIAYAIRDRLGNDPNCGLFAVFDGHGGK